MTRCFGSLTQTLNSQGIPVCANIDCNEPLSGFDISKEQRFCRMCRIKNCVMRWRCRGCPNIITDNDGRPSRQFCDDCRNS